MNEPEINRRLQEFADEFGMDYETPSTFDIIWDYVVSFLATVGFIASVLGLLVLGAWMDGVK